jgi:hypothetical protein
MLVAVEPVNWTPPAWKTLVAASTLGYPGDETGPQRNLIKYWMRRIAWKAPGAWRSCVAQLGPHVAGKGVDVKGMCANLHKAATGLWPTEGHHHPGM